MPIPAGAIPVTDLDATADSPALARATALLPVVQQFNQLISSANTASGMAVLDASGFLAGYGRLAAAQTWTGVNTFTSANPILLSSANPYFRMRNTAVALPAGLWRIAGPASDNALYFESNTAVAGDFSTVSTLLRIDSAGNGTFLGTAGGANATASSHFVNKGQLDAKFVSFSASITTTISAATGVLTKITPNTEAWDSGNYYDSVTNFRFTPPAGKYAISIHGFSTGNPSTQPMTLQLNKNGVLFLTANHIGTNVQSTFYVTANGTDFFEAYITQTSGGTQTVGGVFAGHRIGD